MARVTSKLQVTIPKAIADHYAIEPGQEIDWLEAGDAIRIVPQSARARKADRAWRLELFDAATARQRERQRGIAPAPAGSGRGWSRDELYGRGRAR
jgi:bifunctional DNA-binding transcriptional regulator/antitoxin component of YhaV-PrlF toxin-antitoxin module